MNTPQTSVPTIFTGIVILKDKIAANTYHLKIQSQNFSIFHDITGLAVYLYLSDPYYDSAARRHHAYVWDYDPVYHIADFAITIFSDDTLKDWTQRIQEGDTVFFIPSLLEGSPDITGDHYFLIGTAASLPLLYQIYRALPVVKRVTSVIYAEDKENIFSDLDHSFPLNFFCTRPLNPQVMQEYIQKYFPKNTGHTVSCIAIDDDTDELLYKYIQEHINREIRKM
ncbi:hypothetical protein [Chryseobacterium pennipullorum]|uniref:FAD-binding FR-type domain-containing protein n=1 Tax=Chryseobacterium pennipullorum TaxID=2258963 RepID=A0A3D9AWE1_9FLAO|nr:hypothetical protein [Chryseobacterium pennipullorum]REC45307.1 hypothetical protein DRF67_16610 [Chryseobacterium pennipullorum]